MLGCICFGLLEIPALIIYFFLGSTGASALAAWLTIKRNKHCCKKEGCYENDNEGVLQDS